MSTVCGPSRLRAGSPERSAPPSGGRGEHTESTEADDGSKHRVIVEPSEALARRSSGKKSTERAIACRTNVRVRHARDRLRPMELSTPFPSKRASFYGSEPRPLKRDVGTVSTACAERSIALSMNRFPPQ
jgi:hypothetical protein